ncbi:MAG: type II secretion system GspH family protein [Eggerthellaceae bacterium]|jgi:type IV pilus assembly protein PilA|nr:type II secretion system GspH family protein [Eggerthellaceae bacterium]
MKTTETLKSDKRGFTLVELIVVLVILAVLAAILVPTLIGYINQAGSQKDYAAAQSLREAAQAEIDEHYAEVPSEQNYQVIYYAGGNSGRPKPYNTDAIALAGLDQSHVCYVFYVDAQTHQVEEGCVAFAGKHAYYLTSDNQWTTTKPTTTEYKTDAALSMYDYILDKVQ